MIVCAALVVRPDSPICTPQELAHKVVALDYGNGTAYAALQMLEGAMPREAVTTCAATLDPSDRYARLMREEFDATVLQEPWITAAEKAGCRLIATTFFHGTWVAAPDVDAEVYAAFLRGIGRAVRRINADKRRYVSYFQREFPDAPEVQKLTADDFDLGRIRLREPGPIPEHEARWVWDWMASWGVLHGAFDAGAQINDTLAREAHALAGTVTTR
jgi:ABC-type nitrate/sulfonate/bicarbonate transport system substrate-binding protein